MTEYNLLRWAVRAMLALGVAASVAANILDADPNLISKAIAGWPPVALLLMIELVSRIPTTKRWRGAVRIGATSTIAAIAAWVSYWHMVGTVSIYAPREGSLAYLFPLTVDGLILGASISLVELNAKIRLLSESATSGIAPTSPGMPAVAAPSAAVLAELVKAETAGQSFREAADRLRRESALQGLNGASSTA